MISIEVLQNGVSVANVKRRLGHSKKITISAAANASLWVPHYPLSSEIEVFGSRRGKSFLVLDRPWEGLIVSGGLVIEVDRSDRTYREFPMSKGDYASLTLDDLRMMVKIHPEKAVPKTKFDPSYRGSISNLYFRDSTDKRNFALGALIALLMFVGFAAGLQILKQHRPSEFEQLADSYTVPFISEDHFRNAPEALRQNIDRKDYVGSVVRYYRALTGMLEGWDSVEEKYLYPTSVDTYEAMFTEMRSKIEERENKQRQIEEKELSHQGTAVVAIPSVIGEGIDSGMQRLIDKLDTHDKALEANLKLRREIVKSFPKDGVYDFNQYKSITPPKSGLSEKSLEALGKIRPWQALTDEEALYARGELLGQKAKIARARVERGRQTHAVSGERLGPVEIPSGVEYASFLQGLDYLLSDEKLYQIQASEYGLTKKVIAKIREPLVGEIEPSLIENAIKKYRFELQLCFELALRRNNLARGVMEWKWRIDSRGVISDISLVSSTISDRGMTDCIRDKMARWRFPRPRRGSVEVSYPFEFSPKRG